MPSKKAETTENVEKDASSVEKNVQKRSAERKKLAKKALDALKKQYPTPACALVHLSPFQLLVATILSAQCTDKRVNAVTPALFERFPTPRAFADAPLEAIEESIQSCGFFRSKAKNIAQTSKILVEKYEGEVPRDFEKLVALPGVGRKTANVVLGNAFGVASGFVVDTHVFRFSRKIGLADGETPEKVERELNVLFPKCEWIDASHRLIDLGREFCVARRPKCDGCPLDSFCEKRS